MTAFGEMVKNTTYIVETPKCFVCGDYGPDLDLGLREQMITGTHPKCWDEVYGGGHA